MLFDVDSFGEERLYSAVRALPPNARITLNGSGVSVTALPGGVRTFRLHAPVALARQPRVPMQSLRTARDAVNLLMSMHKVVLEARESPSPERLEVDDG